MKPSPSISIPYFANMSRVFFPARKILVKLLLSSHVSTDLKKIITSRVTKLGNFEPIGLLLEAHYDFLKR
jgi:hypothetical protein